MAIETQADPTAADRAAQTMRADELVALNVEAACTAEMSLSMIVSRVADAALDLSPYPSEDAIQTEANRIWRSFDENRAGPAERLYTVDSNGTVGDWRRPDPPADGQDGITVTELPVANGDAQVGDPVLVAGLRGTIVQFLYRPAREGKRRSVQAGWDVVVRFPDSELTRAGESRVNAADVYLLLDEITREPKLPPDQETTSYGVPTDASFGDDDVKPAPDLARMGRDLIEETDDFPPLRTMPDRVAYFWQKKGGSAGGQPVIYRVRFATKHERRTNGWRVVITFSADVVRSLLLEQADIEALVHESLCQVDRDEHGNLRKLAADFRGWTTNVERFGATVPSVKEAAKALRIEVKDVRNLRMDLDGAEETDEVDTGI